MSSIELFSNVAQIGGYAFGSEPSGWLRANRQFSITPFPSAFRSPTSSDTVEQVVANRVDCAALDIAKHNACDARTFSTCDINTPNDELQEIHDRNVQCARFREAQNSMFCRVRTDDGSRWSAREGKIFDDHAQQIHQKLAAAQKCVQLLVERADRKDLERSKVNAMTPSELNQWEEDYGLAEQARDNQRRKRRDAARAASTAARAARKNKKKRCGKSCSRSRSKSKRLGVYERNKTNHTLYNKLVRMLRRVSRSNAARRRQRPLSQNKQIRRR